MRIALDAMGGDDAPRVAVAGAVEAAREGVTVLLVGRQEALRALLAGYPGAGALPLEVVDAPDVVAMQEHPVNAVRRKPGSSIVVATRLLADGRADALYSAGNSGAVMAAALFTLGRLEGVHRPAIGAVVPLLTGRVLLVDAGANTDCEPVHLLQFAQLGSAYMEHVYGLARPRVGLISIGEEETKGNALVQATYPLLASSGLTFAGNVEGKDVTAGKVDVAVCDGFTGNVMLKTAEGVQELVFNLVRGAVQTRLRYRLAGAVLRPALRAAAKRVDYTEVGGAPLIGVRGPVFIGHGRSNERAIANGIRRAAEAATGDLLVRLQESLGPAQPQPAAPGAPDGTGVQVNVNPERHA
jgi:glycerol-3-phosphate acyltransferase PlsX